MHMVNDKGEAVYFNYVRKNNKDYWLKPPFHPGAAGGALPCPAWFPARLTAVFSGGKNTKEVTDENRV